MKTKGGARFICVAHRRLAAALILSPLTVSALVIVLTLMICTAAATAQEAADAPTAFTFEADLDALAALGDQERDVDGSLFDLRVRAEAEAVAQSGLRLGAIFEACAQRDNGRRGFARAFGETVPSGPAPAGALTGFYSGPDRLDPAGPRAGVETAALSLTGGWGEVSAGFQEGAAVSEADPLPGAFRLARADGGWVDPTGLSLARTRNTLSGQSPKLVVRSARLFGVRASAAFTPKVDFCGVDVCALAPARDLEVADLENALEAAVSVQYAHRESGAVWRAALTGAGASETSAAGARKDPWVASAQLGWERGDLSLGAAALWSNDGVKDGDYVAYAVSSAWERGPWLAAIEAAYGASDLVQAEGWSLQAGASRYFEGGVLVGAGLMWAEQTVDSDGEAAAVAFLEAGLRF